MKERKENRTLVDRSLRCGEFKKQLKLASRAELFKEIVQRFAQIENPQFSIDVLSDIYIEWSYLTKEPPGTDRYNTLALNMQFTIELLRDIRDLSGKQELLKASIRACS